MAGIRLVNMHLCARKMSTVLGYFDVAESENDLDFFELALVFEIFYMFFQKRAKIRKF